MIIDARDGAADADAALQQPEAESLGSLLHELDGERRRRADAVKALAVAKKQDRRVHRELVAIRRQINVRIWDVDLPGRDKYGSGEGQIDRKENVRPGPESANVHGGSRAFFRNWESMAVMSDNDEIIDDEDAASSVAASDISDIRWQNSEVDLSSDLQVT